MDINSLLSPQTSPDDGSTIPKTTPASLRRTPSTTLKPDLTASSREQASPQHPQLPHGAIAQAQQVLPTSPLISSGSSQIKMSPKTQSSESQGGRQVSTPGMDALADLASMQHHHQIARANASGPRSAEVLEAHQRPMSHVKGVARARASPRPGLDHRGSSSLTSLTTTTTPVVPRTYTASSLSESELASIASLVSDLAENPYLYESHLKLIGLLRKGLIDHVQPPSDPFIKGEPHTYELLQDLREARETMASRFPPSEKLWADWISDEIMLAKSVEDRVGVIELCQKAVAEEVGSLKLWLLYGNWVFRLFHASRPGALGDLASKYELDGDSGWSDEEKVVGAEIFGWDTMLEVWRQGARATEWRIHDSHLIWDRYAELLLEDLANGPNKQKVSCVRALFDERLQIPHATWDQTFQLFSTFMTNYDNASYEESMVSTTKRAADAKEKYSLREVFELRLNQAMHADEELAIWTVFREYLDWEVGQVRKKTGSYRLSNALFERAVLQVGTNADLWEDYVFFIVDSTNARETGVSPLAVLQRATRHCPWSGTLWAQYLLSSESEDKPFHEVEEVKHKATSTGLMDIGGMEEVLKAYAAWCAYLNRRAFHDKATDEEADVAEVGIRSAIESVKELGEKKHGKDYAGDPNYRLQRIYVEYLSRSGLWDRARTEVWKSLVPSRGDSYEFWIRWYHWEMMYWYTLGSTVGGKSAMPTPASATSVLRQAVTRRDLDWPEKILEVYIDHVRDFESVGNLQTAVIQARRIAKGVAKRRQREAEQATLIQQQQQKQQERQAAAESTSPSEEPTTAGKRKRDSGVDETDGNASKKSRPETKANDGSQGDIQNSSTTSIFKRDREHTTVIVRKIPLGVSETNVRQFFRDCGKINSLKLIPENDDESLTATIEFESTEDVLAAQTKDMKYLEGHPIEVQLGTGTTIFVTNFPPTADELYIRDLFKECGEIIDVRFPSLKYNTHRRFCYVQFRSSEQAEQATQLDRKEVGEKLKLAVKISDPGHKQNRTGPLYEGREIYISNLDWSATEEEVGEIFSKYGTVERVRIPKNLAGKSKGFAFVVFSSKEEAEAALDMNLTKFKSRILNVSLSTVNPTKRQATTIVNRDTLSKSTSPPPQNGPSESNGLPSPSANVPSSDQPPNHPTKTTIQSRTLALLNVPDTVNSARIRSVMEPYGPLVKIILRPDHQGAMIEYAHTNDAGKAALGIEGYEIVPGRKIRVGTVKELLGMKEEVKREKGVFGSSTKENKDKDKSGGVGGRFGSSGIVKRPTLGSGAERGGRRGGLGRRGGIGGLVPSTKTSVDKSEMPKKKEEKEGEDTKMGEGDDSNQDDHNNNINTNNNNGTTVEGKAGDANTEEKQEETEKSESRPKGKTNADFKALYLGLGER